MTPMRLEPAALRSRVNQSTTEPLRSLKHGGTCTSTITRWIIGIIGMISEASDMGARIHFTGHVISLNSLVVKNTKKGRNNYITNLLD